MIASLAAAMLMAAPSPAAASRLPAPALELGLTARTEPELCRVLALQATKSLAPRLDGSMGLRVTVSSPLVRVNTFGSIHPATYRAGAVGPRDALFTNARYKVRLDLHVELVDARGQAVARKTFTGRAAQVVRDPPPHPYRSFVSIHALGRRHQGCSAYPEREALLGLALHDAMKGREGASAWTARQTR
jgi:hypothetical protein